MAKSANMLDGARVYLSGPMDFVASRANEMKYGWRNRVSQFLKGLGVTVFDPWYKPQVRGLHEYGREGVDPDIRDKWTFERSERGERVRSKLADKFWSTMHIDLRTVDTSDFVVAYCPTNIYSVGTPHEIVVCRQQHKPVLFVSPPVRFPALTELQALLKRNRKASALLKTLVDQVPIKENPTGVPSLWYMPLVGSESFFDGFGFSSYRKAFGWKQTIPLDRYEEAYEIRSPLLPFLERLPSRLPEKWDAVSKRHVPNDDWLLWDLQQVRDHKEPRS